MSIEAKPAVSALVPGFLSNDLTARLDHYRDTLGFSILFEYGDPGFYAGVQGDEQAVFFRATGKAVSSPSQKFSEEWVDACIIAADIVVRVSRSERQRGDIHPRAG